MSSILRIMRTVSTERLMADVETSSGCTTFSSRMSVMQPLLTFTPAVRRPSACLFRNSVTANEGKVLEFVLHV